MSITLKQLYNESKNKYRLELIAGNAGICNIVSWLHFMEDETTLDFIRGNELVVTTGLGAKNERWLNDFIKGLIIRNASGLMVNLGPYISVINQDIINLCNDNNFPLLTIPWDIHLVDIMQNYCNNIMEAEQHSSNICAAFFNAVFSPKQKDTYIPRLKQEGYDLSGKFLVISIDLDKSIYKKINEIKLKNFIMRIENTLNSTQFKYSILNQNNEFNIIINFIDQQNSLACLKDHIVNNLKNFSQIKHIGISSIAVSIENLHKAYNEASDAIYSGIKDDKFIVYYDDMGIDKIILNISDNKILYDIYNKYLGVIHDYDKAHNTDYENTLKIYLKNNCSIQAVSEVTYTHRNTINYRIKKIKSILNSELDDSEEKFNYMLAFYIKEILDMN